MNQETLKMNVTVEPEQNPELAAMNMLDQIMAWLESTNDGDAAVSKRVAAWLASKYGANS